MFRKCLEIKEDGTSVRKIKSLLTHILCDRKICNKYRKHWKVDLSFLLSGLTGPLNLSLFWVLFLRVFVMCYFMSFWLIHNILYLFMPSCIWNNMFGHDKILLCKLFWAAFTLRVDIVLWVNTVKSFWSLFKWEFSSDLWLESR